MLKEISKGTKVAANFFKEMRLPNFFNEEFPEAFS
jgi:hypothetical protein